MARRFTLDTRKFNPNGFWLLQAFQDRRIRYCVMQGGSSSAKSYSFAEAVVWQTLVDGCNTIVLRKVGASIRRTIYKDFEENARRVEVNGGPAFRCTQNNIRCLVNGADIDFTGMDDSEKIKGIASYKRIFMDELTDFEERDWMQMRSRMRGMEGQQLFAAFNPISERHWVKTRVFDLERWHAVENRVELYGTEISPELTRLKEALANDPQQVLNPRTGEVATIPPNFLWLKSTYLDNFWVVGSPDGTYGYYDVQCVANYEHDRTANPDYYRVYALGEWGVVRTGGEALPSFRSGCVARKAYDPSLPVHLSVDNNVLPYITTTFWQVDPESRRVWQFAELCASDPDNTATRAGDLVAERLRCLGVGKVYLHGDVSTKAASTIDDEKRSFFDKYMERLEGFGVEDCTPSANPSVRASLEFINALLDGWGGWTLEVDEGCVHSIEDYMSVKKDVNGGILKVRVKDTATRQSYERHGHCTDTMRYALCDMLREEYAAHSLRRKRHVHAGLNYIGRYEATGRYTFIVPSFDGTGALAVVALCGDRIVVEDALLVPGSLGEEDISSRIRGEAVMECERPFYDLARGVRRRFPSLAVKSPRQDAGERIKATAGLHGRLYFLQRQDGPYLSFLESLQDYDGRDSRPAANLVAMALQWLVKKGLA